MQLIAGGCGDRASIQEITDTADIGFGWSYFDSEDQLFATASGQVMDRWGQALPARAVLLIIWVGLFAMFRSITDIVLAFELKSGQRR